MKPKINVARSMDDTRPVVGHVIMKVTRTEVEPIYAIENGQTYGQILDGMIDEFFGLAAENGSNDMLNEIAFELGDDAQRALREQAMEKRRTAY